MSLVRLEAQASTNMPITLVTEQNYADLNRFAANSDPPRKYFGHESYRAAFSGDAVVKAALTGNEEAMGLLQQIHLIMQSHFSDTWNGISSLGDFSVNAGSPCGQGETKYVVSMSQPTACYLSVTHSEKERSWSYTMEPRCRQITPSGPALDGLGGPRKVEEESEVRPAGRRVLDL